MSAAAPDTVSRTQDWQFARNVLCVRLDTLGDVLMTTPALRAIKESLPTCRITLLTSPRGAEPARCIPEIDDTIVYESPWMKSSPTRPNSRYDRAMIDQIRDLGFDAAVIFTVFSQNPQPAALLTYLADIPLRLAHSRENPYHLLTDWVKETEPEQGIRHEVRRQLDLVAMVGLFSKDERLSFNVTEPARRCAEEALLRAGLAPTHPWIIIHPGVSAPSRQYPPELYARAAARLVKEDGLQIVFTGSVNEVDLVEHIRGQMGAPSHSVAGQLNLEELGGLLQLSPLLLSNNTGPVHIAAAVGTPVVDLYALTNPQHTPWGVPNRVLYHDVPCKFCYKSVCPEGHHHCLRLVTPEQVAQAVRELLQETSSTR